MNNCMQAQQQLKQHRIRLNDLVATLVSEFGYRDARQDWPRSSDELVVSPSGMGLNATSYREAIHVLEEELIVCRGPEGPELPPERQGAILNDLIAVLVSELGFRDVHQNWPEEQWLVVSPRGLKVGASSYKEAIKGLEDILEIHRGLR